MTQLTRSKSESLFLQGLRHSQSAGLFQGFLASLVHIMFLSKPFQWAMDIFQHYGFYYLQNFIFENTCISYLKTHIGVQKFNLSRRRNNHKTVGGIRTGD